MYKNLCFLLTCMMIYRLMEYILYWKLITCRACHTFIKTEVFPHSPLFHFQKSITKIRYIKRLMALLPQQTLLFHITPNSRTTTMAWHFVPFIFYIFMTQRKGVNPYFMPPQVELVSAEGNMLMFVIFGIKLKCLTVFSCWIQLLHGNHSAKNIGNGLCK